MERRLILPFWILASVPFIMVLGNSMLIPVFPQLKSELDLTQFQVGLLVTAFSVPAGIVIPFAGSVSDYIGRKKILFPALLLYGAGGLIAGLASLLLTSPFTWIMVGRVVQGIGAGGTYQIALALTGDLFSGGERTKAVGILEATNGLGKMISPVAGAALGLIIWYAPFFTYGLLAIPIGFAVWYLVNEPDGKRQKQSPKQYIASLARIFNKKAVPLLCSYLAGAVGLFLLFGLLSFISDELEAQHNLFGVTKGLVLAIPVTVMTITAYVSGILLQERNNLLVPAIATGLSLAAGGLIGLAFLPGLIAMIGFASIMGIGIGLKLPALNTLITGATDADERGLITALYGTVRFFGVALGPPTFGLVQGGGRLPMFLAGAAIAGIALTLVLLFVRPNKILVDGERSKSHADAQTGKKHIEQFSPKDVRDTTQGKVRLNDHDHDPF